MTGARLVPLFLLLAGATPPPAGTQEPAGCRSPDGALRDTLYAPLDPRGSSAPLDSALDRGPAAEYGKERSWFVAHEEIRFGDGTYIAFGVPRRWETRRGAERIVRVGSHDGVPMFALVRDTPTVRPVVLYLLADRGCVFQAYQERSTIHINYGPSRPVADPVPAFVAVLEHLRATESRGANRPLVLSGKRMRWPGDDAPARPSHPDSVLGLLQRRAPISGTCSGGDAASCARPVPAVLVFLDEVTEPPVRVFVHIPPGDPPTGERLRELIAAMPDSAAVPVDLEVDVWLTGLCAPVAGARGCDPATRRYMYFLRIDAAGNPVVLGRWLVD